MLVAVASVLGGAALTAGPAAATPAPPRATLSAITCRSTLDPTGRQVSVTSVMRPIAHTRNLSVRFSLLQKTPETPAAPVTHGDLGSWVSPTDPTLGRRARDVWKLDKVVYAVPAPAVYRFRVDFRWRGRGGQVLQTTTLASSSCHVHELRPDVLVRGVRVLPARRHPRLDRYVAVVANQGLSASGPFSVTFTPSDGAAAQTAAVASLAPDTATHVRFVGPACSTMAAPTIVADPTNAVDDFDRANNTFPVVCPGTADTR